MLYSRSEILRLLRDPGTDEVLALRLIPTLVWPDLVEVGLDTRVRPTLRRAADRQLVARLPGLGVGEKVAIARRASARVLERLRHDPSPRVVRSVLENPRVTEGLLLPLVSHEEARSEALEEVARSRRWGARYEVRVALCHNPRTPATTALRLLPHLRKRDLRRLLREVRVPAVVRRRAEVLLGVAT